MHYGSKFTCTVQINFLNRQVVWGSVKWLGVWCGTPQHSVDISVTVFHSDMFLQRTATVISTLHHSTLFFMW